jgi:hypothetical protein
MLEVYPFYVIQKNGQFHASFDPQLALSQS